VELRSAVAYSEICVRGFCAAHSNEIRQDAHKSYSTASWWVIQWLVVGLSSTDLVAELDGAILEYLVSRGFTRAVKAFEGESGVKAVGTAGSLEEGWASRTSA